MVRSKKKRAASPGKFARKTRPGLSLKDRASRENCRPGGPRYFVAFFAALALGTLAAFAASARRSCFFRRWARFFTLSLPWLFPIMRPLSPASSVVAIAQVTASSRTAKDYSAAAPKKIRLTFPPSIENDPAIDRAHDKALRAGWRLLVQVRRAGLPHRALNVSLRAACRFCPQLAKFPSSPSPARAEKKRLFPAGLPEPRSPNHE